MNFCDSLRAHRGELLRLTTPLFSPATGFFEEEADRVLLLVDVLQDSPRTNFRVEPYTWGRADKRSAVWAGEGEDAVVSVILDGELRPVMLNSAYTEFIDLSPESAACPSTTD